MKQEYYQKIIERFLEGFCPIEEAKKLDNHQNFIFLSTRFPQLAADTLLKKEVCGKLPMIILEATQQFHSVNREEKDFQKFGETLIEVCLNIFGLEAKRIGFSPQEELEAIKIILDFFKRKGKPFLKPVIETFLSDINRVLSGKSLASQMAKNIEAKLDENNLVESFVFALRSEIQNNVYYKMADRGFSKFGNDSATGLRIVRHFDFVQVSSNPVIAARAYEEFPELWQDFGKIVEVNPEWRKNPEKYADEITLFATINSILPNILVFRPLALLSDFQDGLVSYQLNPFFAEKTKASIEDAKKICSVLQNILYFYDQWLGWDAKKWQGRPNIVFKVAASTPTAIEITKKLNEIGIGTNNTVTYSVSQELTLLLAEAEGMAKAMKKGILPSQVYQTNMIGRTEDHLRENEAERLVEKLNDEEFGQLAKSVIREIPAAKNRQEITRTLCSKKYFKSLDDERLVEALKKYYGEETASTLKRLEEDIHCSGIFVTRKVYQIFFENKLKILGWLEKKFKLSYEQAELVFDRIDLLPASKRRANDTYLVLGAPNVTNTEFPDQQLKVYLESTKEDFKLDNYRQSIRAEIDSDVLQRLLETKDFQRIYELYPEISKKLKEIGIEGNFGDKGMEPKEWKNYGAVIKTMAEFKNAHQDFQEKILEFVKI
ncbi:MAG: hypothetical protein COV69_03025 [Parcubacteria group bacterium CG11_big_fil_rev_8_21_14_0_20_39_14]|nr:MAG: hypothetical protein COV69_03025 [Parcubacteria group bacterium CG11_big_fil_rev_8_21_14_0_20_39_14]PIS35213.1 MAG: hypothetical protein COT36_03565 [Parcubacteria group bacterium CG08_land_8_20_14_0_20_38_56]